MTKIKKNPTTVQKFFARGLLVVVPVVGALLLLLWVLQAFAGYLYLWSLLILIPVMIF